MVNLSKLCLLLVPGLSSSFTVLPSSNEMHLHKKMDASSAELSVFHPSRIAEKKRGLNLSPQDVIEAGVSFDTFAPQLLWLPMIVAPESDLTKKIMGANGIPLILGLALVHLAIVVTAAAQEGALDQILIFKEVFEPSNSQLGGMQKLFQYPNFVAEEWPHVLIWDLFVGRMIWLDGLERGVNTRISLSFCNFIGPPGLLIHAATCVLTGKGLPPMGYTSETED